MISQRVRKVQSRVFDLIDARISKIEEARHRKLDHQTALERFDGEGGAMQATPGEVSEETLAPEATPSRNAKPGFGFEPGLQH